MSKLKVENITCRTQEELEQKSGEYINKSNAGEIVIHKLIPRVYPDRYVLHIEYYEENNGTK